jgi:polar amino acid transport system substrate-binding protein
VRSGTEGLDDQIAKTILARADCDIEIVRFEGTVTLERRMSLLEAGDIDLIIAVNKRPEREKIANFSIPFEEELIRLWAKEQDHQKYQGLNLAELTAKGVRILAPGSGYFGPEFEQLKQTAHPQLVLYKHIQHGMNLLYRNRGDVLLGSHHFEEYFQDEYKGSTIKLSQVLHRDGYHFMFSKKTVDQKTIDLINTAITDYHNEMKTTKPVD